MLSPSLNHLPFMLDGADVSLTIEQQIPLSGIRQHRRSAALADIDRFRAEADRTALDVSVQAANAFLMLQERRRTAALVAEQVTFAGDVVTAANARYASGTAPQSDVLRAEVEVARLQALSAALVSDVRAAEAMLNASLALDTDRPVPPLAPVADRATDTRVVGGQKRPGEPPGIGRRPRRAPCQPQRRTAPEVSRG